MISITYIKTVKNKSDLLRTVSRRSQKKPFINTKKNLFWKTAISIQTRLQNNEKGGKCCSFCSKYNFLFEHVFQLETFITLSSQHQSFRFFVYKTP